MKMKVHANLMETAQLDAQNVIVECVLNAKML